MHLAGMSNSTQIAIVQNLLAMRSVGRVWNSMLVPGNYTQRLSSSSSSSQSNRTKSFEPRKHVEW